MKTRDLEAFRTWEDAWALVRRRPGAVLVLATLGAFPSSVLSVVWSINPSAAEHPFAYPLNWLSIVFFAYFMTHSISELSRRGEGDVRAIAASSSIRRFSSFAATRLLMTVLLVPFALIFAVPVWIVLAVSPADALNATMPAALVAPLVGIMLGFLFYGLAAPANVVERLGPATALRRSWRVTEGRRKDFAILCLGPFLLTGLFFAIREGLSGRSLNERIEAPAAAGLVSRPAGTLDPLSVSDALLQGLWTYGEGMLSSAVWAALLTTYFIRLRSSEPDLHEKQLR